MQQYFKGMEFPVILNRYKITFIIIIAYISILGYLYIGVNSKQTYKLNDIRSLDFENYTKIMLCESALVKAATNNQGNFLKSKEIYVIKFNSDSCVDKFITSMENSSEIYRSFPGKNKRNFVGRLKSDNSGYVVYDLGDRSFSFTLNK